MKILFDEHKISYRELYRKLMLTKNNILSFETFSIHLNKLKNDNFISLSESRRGKKRFYSITKIGKRFYGLDQINTDTNKQLYQKILEELFLEEFRKGILLFNNKNYFLNFLKEHNIFENELEWTSRPIETGSNSDIINFIYGPDKNLSKNTFLKKRQEISQEWKQFWITRKNSFVLEDLEWLCKPIKRRGYKIWIQKTEHWQLNKDGNHYNYATTFSIDLPGISYDLRLSDKKLYYIDNEGNTKKNRNQKIVFTAYEIKHIIDSFIKYELVKIIKIGKTQRIVISDPKLQKLIGYIKNLLTIHLNQLELYCSLYKKPTKDEIKSIEYLIGRKESKSLFQRLSLLRSEEMKLRYKIMKSKVVMNKTEQVMTIATQDYYEFIRNRFKNSLLYKYLEGLSCILDSTTSDYVLKNAYLNNNGLKYVEMMQKFKNYEELGIDEYSIVSIVFFMTYRDYVPREIKRLNERINVLKERQLEVNSRYEKKNIIRLIKMLENKKNRLENFSDIPDFIKYVQEDYNYNYLEWFEDVLRVREVYKDLFTQYGYILDRLFRNIFPVLKKSTFDDLLNMLDNGVDKDEVKKQFEVSIKRKLEYEKWMEDYYEGKSKPRIIRF